MGAVDAVFRLLECLGASGRSPFVRVINDCEFLNLESGLGKGHQ